MSSITLNGFEVDSRLANLMRRDDWGFCRGKKKLWQRPLIANSEAWLEHFNLPRDKYPDCEKITGIDFLDIDAAIRENKNLRNTEIASLLGKPSSELPPGDFDPTQGYLVGMTCEVDEGIYVDLRPKEGPIITYSVYLNDFNIVTAFNSIDLFVQFYIEQHGP